MMYIFFQNSMFVTVNTTIQVKLITKLIYINVDHDIFRPLLSHYQVCLSLLLLYYMNSAIVNLDS
jgi:hypothetical protein